MKKLLLTITILFALSGCDAVDWALNVDKDGVSKEGAAPIDYLSEVLEAFGTVGGLASAGLAMAGTAYVSNKRSKDPLKAVIAGVQKLKEELGDEEKALLTAQLKKHIPNKYHKVIGKIKDTL